MMLALLVACQTPPGVLVGQCSQPLVELISWRDKLEGDFQVGYFPITAEALAAEEKRRVEAVVDILTPRRALCARHWTVLLYQPPSNPSLRLREEVILRLLEAPPHDYSPEAVGHAGITTSGRKPMEGVKER